MLDGRSKPNVILPKAQGAGRLAGGVLDSVRLSAAQAAAVLACAAAVVLVTVLLASLSITRKRPKDILTDLS